MTAAKFVFTWLDSIVSRKWWLPRGSQRDISRLTVIAKWYRGRRRARACRNAAERIHVPRRAWCTLCDAVDIHNATNAQAAQAAHAKWQQFYF